MTYIVSDWHLDDGTGPCNKNRQVMNDFLDLVGRDEIVFLGDTLELWRNTYEEIHKGPNWPTVQRIKNHVILYGNHDRYPKIMRGIFTQGPFEEIEIGLKGVRKRIVHGDEFDPMLSGVRMELAAKFDRMVFLFNNEELNKVADAYSAADRSNAPLLEAVKRNGGNWIMGHSHKIARAKNFMNSGSGIGKSFYYIKIEDSTGEATLVKFK
jgi:predicted phosphodiesterase